MENKVTATPKTLEKIEAFVNCVKERNGDYITAGEIAKKLGVSTHSVHNMVYNHIKKMYPEIDTGSREGYRWIAPEEPKEEKTSTKNYEGYNDPTASAVLKKFDRQCNVRAGEIWSTSNQDLYFMILASYPGTVVGLNVCRMDTWFDPENDMTLNLKGKSYYINIRRIVSRAARSLVANEGSVGKERLLSIRTAIGMMLDIRTEPRVVEKPVEVIREKIVEKPIEVEKVVFRTKFDKRKLKRISSLTLAKLQLELAKSKTNAEYFENQLLLQKQRADIWEKAFMVANGKGE